MTDSDTPFHIPVSIQHPHLNVSVDRNASAAAVAAPSVSTNGWDCSYVIHVDEVNKAIAREKSSPKSFSHDGIDGHDASMSGTFGDWQVAAGSSGDILHLHVPLTTASLEYNGEQFDLSGATATIEIQLEFSEAAKSTSPAVRTEELKVKTSGDSPTDPSVAVVSLAVPPGKPLGFVAKAVFQGLLNHWLADHLAEFTYVFATVDLNLKPEDRYAWIKPSFANYAYVDSPDADAHGILGILAMTGADGRARGEKLPAQLSPGTLPANANAALIVSPRVLLNQLLLPALAGVFEDSTSDDFELIGGTQIRSKNALSLPNVKASEKIYSGKIEPQWFTLSVDSNGLVLSSPNLKINYAPGVEISFHLEEHLAVELKARPGGGHALWFEQTACTCTHQVHCSLPGTSLKDAVNAILPFIESALGLLPAEGIGSSLSKVSRRILGGTYAVLETGLPAKRSDTDAYAAQLAREDFESLPDFDIPVSKAIQSVKWSGASETVLLSAALHGSLVLMVDPAFSD